MRISTYIGFRAYPLLQKLACSMMIRLDFFGSRVRTLGF